MPDVHELGRYAPLDSSRKEIRLLHILPPESNDDLEPVRGSVTRKSLEDVPVHQYVALSYVWGHELSRTPLVVDDRHVTITANLFDFLVRYRKMSLVAPQWRLADQDLWIDAICINQSDIEERNSQVQMMGRIYRSASAMIAWLGLDGDDSSYAIANMLDVLPKMSRAIREKDLVGWLDAEANDLWQPNREREREEGASFTSENRFWDSAGRLLTREYWKRSWIAQELVLSKNVMLLCGQTPLPLAALWVIWEWLLRIEGLPCPPAVDGRLWSYLSTRSGRRLLSWGTLNKLPNFMDLSDLAARAPESELPILWREFVLHTRISQATDPRDKLYSVLGMLNRGIAPDYSASTEDVYCDFAKRCILTEKRLSVLCYAGHGMFFGNPEFPTHRLFVPSWVPNWDALSKEFSWGQFYHEGGGRQADGGCVPELLSFDGRALAIKGLSVDIISSSRRLTNNTDDLLVFCNEYLAAHINVDNRAYISGIPLLQALIRLLYLDKNPFGDGANTGIDSMALLKMAFLCGLITGHGAKSPAGIHVPATLPEVYNKIIGPLDREEGPEIIQKTSIELLKETQSSEVQTSFTSITSTRLSLVMNYVAFWTREGYLGWGPPGMQAGDEVCVLQGCEMPVVLRRVDEHYVHIGPAWVLGLMNGEAFRGIEGQPGLITKFMIV